MRLSISYDLLKKWKAMVFTAFVGVLFYQTIIYLHPSNLDWVGSEAFSWLNTFQFLLIDQFLVECITVFFIFQLIRRYATKLDLTQLDLSAKDIMVYELKFLPVLLVSFFVFAPFTLTVRFLYKYLPDLEWNVYFSEYFYSTTLYFNYLTPVLLMGYVIINVNLIYCYNKQLGQTQEDLNHSKKAKIKTRLRASDEFGEVFLDTDNISWIEKSDRKTLATVASEKFRLKENVSELEEKLDPNKFVRINRSAIVNLDQVLNYSFWENDKYVLRMKDKSKEFVMSRDRLNKIKDRLMALDD